MWPFPYLRLLLLLLVVVVVAVVAVVAVSAVGVAVVVVVVVCCSCSSSSSSSSSSKYRNISFEANSQLVKTSATPKISSLAVQQYFLYCITPDTHKYLYTTTKYFKIIL